MQKVAKILFITTIVLMLLWLLPWSYRFVTAKSYKTPFTLYSGIVNDFAILDSEGKTTLYTDLSGNQYTEKQFNSILPLFYFRQLVADEHLPDTLNGVAISPRLIQNENFIFRSSPLDVNKATVPLYPLLESMSGRVDLAMPDDVFRMDERMEFIDISSNTIKEKKSRLFTDMLTKKGFAFPTQIISGNSSARKEYDEGYLMTDRNGKLFHVKQVKERPYVRLIETPAELKIKHIYVTEFKNQKFLAFIVDEQFRFWVLKTKSYEFCQVEIPAFDPTKMSISIIANMFDWTITVKEDKQEKLYAIHAGDFSLIKSMEYPEPSLTKAQTIGQYIFPIRLEFSSNLNSQIFPRIKFINN